MSICHIRGISTRICRQAFILSQRSLTGNASGRGIVATVPANNELRLSLCCTRHAHNDIYHMPKRPLPEPCDNAHILNVTNIRKKIVSTMSNTFKSKMVCGTGEKNIDTECDDDVNERTAVKYEKGTGTVAGVKCDKATTAKSYKSFFCYDKIPETNECEKIEKCIEIKPCDVGSTVDRCGTSTKNYRFDASDRGPKNFRNEAYDWTPKIDKCETSAKSLNNSDMRRRMITTMNNPLRTTADCGNNKMMNVPLRSPGDCGDSITNTHHIRSIPNCGDSKTMNNTLRTTTDCDDSHHLHAATDCGDGSSSRRSAPNCGDTKTSQSRSAPNCGDMKSRKREIADCGIEEDSCGSGKRKPPVCDSKMEMGDKCDRGPKIQECPRPKKPADDGYNDGLNIVCNKQPPGGEDNEGSKNMSKLWYLWFAALGTGALLYFLKQHQEPTPFQECNQEPPPPPPLRIPENSSDLPKHISYLLIGGGTASFSAFRAIKSNDPKAKILMITNENRKPYMRPPLSKELWYSAEQGEVSKDYRFKQWTGSERSLFFEPDEFFVDPKKLLESANGGIAVAQGYTVRKIDPTNHIVTLTDGYEIGYDECLIATGCTPKNLDVFMNATPSVKEKVMLYRTPDDFERLKRFADEKKSITIVGNGFTGSELACSLANYTKGKDVKIYQVFSENANMSRVLPDYLSKWTTQKVEALGVCVLPRASIKTATRDEEKLKLALNNGKTILTDVVVVCVGCDPNTSIATVSGLEVDDALGGFVVNAELEARRNLFVAGDASCFYDPLLGRRRVEHHDHSVISGRLAGENMVGKKKAYSHQSMFWSDLGPEIGYEGIGMVDSSLPTVGVFALPSPNGVDREQTDNLSETRDEVECNDCSKQCNTPPVTCNKEDKENYGRGVIFYLKNDKIVGILLWNLFNRIGLARTIINQNKKYSDLNEVAKLFEIHS